jgi:hypothetical protein
LLISNYYFTSNYIAICQNFNTFGDRLKQARDRLKVSGYKWILTLELLLFIGIYTKFKF